MTAEPSADGESPSIDSAASVEPWKPSKRGFLRVSMFVFTLLVLYVGFTFLDVWYSSRRSSDTVEAQAALVLGAAQYDGEPSPVLQARLDRALLLFENEQVGLVVVTGGSQDGDITTEAKAGYDYLRRQGIPDESLRLEVDGTSTYESLAASRRFLLGEDIEDVVLVTSAYHSRRVQLVAEELGLEASVSPVGDATFGRLSRETVAVAIGRVVTFRRLDWIRP